MAPEPYRGAILTALYTGLRFGDVAHLRWQDIGPDSLDVTPSKTAGHQVAVSVPLHPRLAEYFAGRARDGDLVFPDLAARYKSGHRRGEFAALLKAAGIEERPGEYLSFHSLRHTFRTRLAAAGVPQEIAQRLGGWLTPAMAARYNHDRTQAIDAIRRLP